MRTLSSDVLIISESEGRESDIVFNFVNSLSIESTYSQLTDLATVVVPRKIKYIDGQTGEELAIGSDPIFKRGDQIYISVGYDLFTEQIFAGRLSGIKTKYPLEFECQDEMYMLKQNSFTFSLKNPTLSELLEKIIPNDIPYEITADQKLGNIRVNNANAAEILDKLRTENGVYSFFRDQGLYVGLAVVPALQNTVKFEFFKDIIDSSSLVWGSAEDRKIQIKAISILEDNTRLEATAGDESGSVQTFFFYGIDNVADLQKIADAQLGKVRFDGYEGSFTTFVAPRVNHGDVVELLNPQIPEQSGSYLVEKVVTTCSVTGGGRQEIYIKQKIADG